MQTINFEFTEEVSISTIFKDLGISNFSSACNYISELPYSRNINKSTLSCVFTEQRGTCSTKHAVLRKLVLEQKREDVKLILGLFKMDATYAPKIAKTLSLYGLEYIPEAHNYLKIGDQFIDFTLPTSNYNDFSHLLIRETEIEYDQICTLKIQIHQEFLSSWIIDKPPLSLDAIWEIREECIRVLQS